MQWKWYNINISTTSATTLCIKHNTENLLLCGWTKFAPHTQGVLCLH